MVFCPAPLTANMQQNMMPMEGNSFLNASKTEVLYNKFIDAVKSRNAAVAMVKSTIRRGLFATERASVIGTRARYVSALRWCKLTRTRVNFANECLEIVAECVAAANGVENRAASANSEEATLAANTAGTVAATEASNNEANLIIMEIAARVSDAASFTVIERRVIETVVRTNEPTSAENDAANLTTMENNANEAIVSTIEATSTENDAANLTMMENTPNEASVSTIETTSTENDEANLTMMENTSNEATVSTEENTSNENANITTMEKTLTPSNAANHSITENASTVSNAVNLTIMEKPSTLCNTASLTMIENTSTPDTLSTNEAPSTENNAASFTIKEAALASTNAAVVAASVPNEKSSGSHVAFSGASDTIVNAAVSESEQNQMEIAAKANDERKPDIKNCVQISSKKRKHESAEETESDSSSLPKRINI